jgi:pSer/pThr/pTyr-binding forkhead associated (FHA) protein
MSQFPIKPTIQQSAASPIVGKPIKPTLQQDAAQPERSAPLASSGHTRPAQSPAAGGPNASASAERARPFIPLFRPPMAVLEILDDGAEEGGETIRIRSDSITIGRSEADVVIPHDGQISGTHASLTRRFIEGAYHWFLTDLKSKNGTFIRVARAPLSEGQLVLLGSHRYRFRAAAPLNLPATAAPEQPKGTQGWQAVSAADIARMQPALVRMGPDGSERDFPLVKDELAIGQNPAQCQIVFDDDPAVSSLHARVRRDDEGRLILEDARSRNGVWLAVRERRFVKAIKFQLGEQRFRVKVLACS